MARWFKTAIVLFTLINTDCNAIAAASRSCESVFQIAPNALPLPYMANLPNTVDIGAQVVFKMLDNSDSAGTFMGRLVGIDNEQKVSLFIDGDQPEIALFPLKSIVGITTADGQKIEVENLRPQLMTIRQDRPLCAGIACFDALRLVSQYGMAPHETLNTIMQDTAGRVRALTNIIDEFFILTRGRPDVYMFDKRIAAYVGQFGLQRWYYSARNSWPANSKRNIVADVKYGWPVILIFNTVKESFENPYPISLFSESGRKTKSYVPRAFFPSDSYSLRNDDHGVHAVVATGYVELKGKAYFIVSDPNLTMPVLWPLDFFDRAHASDLSAWSLIPRK